MFCAFRTTQSSILWLNRRSMKSRSSTRGPDAVTQQHQQSERCSQDRRECAVARTRTHPQRTIAIGSEADGSCVLCCCRAVSLNASAEDCNYRDRGNFITNTFPTNGNDRSQIFLNTRSVCADLRPFLRFKGALLQA